MIWTIVWKTIKIHKLDGSHVFPSLVCCGGIKLHDSNGWGSDKTCTIYHKAIPNDIWKGTKMLEEHCDEKGCCPFYEEIDIADFEDLDLDEDM